MVMKIGKGFSLPATIADDVIAIVGRRGRGKTTTATRIVEQLHAAGERFAVLDPIGVWWGLRSDRAGTGPGLPVIVMGGDRGDVPLEETAGKVVAQFIAESAQSVVLDLSMFRKGQMVRFATDFLEELYHKNRAALHLVLDEADRFAPQRSGPESARLLGAAEDVCKMGRARGLHPILITQRPAGLNKNVLNQAGMLVAHALTGPQDRKALDEWVRANAEEGQLAAFTRDLPSLDRGVAWFWQPDEAIFQQVPVLDRETFDSSATPKGGKRVAPKVLAPVDLDALKVRIADTIERAKAEDPKALRARIATLQKALDEKATELDRRVSKLDALAKVPLPKTIERSVLKPADLKRLEAAVDKLEVANSVFQGGIRQAIDSLSQRQQVVVVELASLRALLERSGQATTAPLARPVAAPAAPHVSRAPVAARRAEPAGDLTGPEQRILDALAWLESVGQAEPEQAAVAFLAGYTVGGGAFNNPRGALRGKGLLDYLPGDRMVLTDAGRGKARVSDVPLTAGDMQAAVLARLPGPEQKILRVVLDAYPESIANDEAARAAGYEPGGGAFNNPRGRLRTLGLIEYPRPGALRARKALFLEA